MYNIFGHLPRLLVEVVRYQVFLGLFLFGAAVNSINIFRIFLIYKVTVFKANIYKANLL